MNRTLTRVAMMTAAMMVAHQVGAKAFRDAAFLTAWPATALPMMAIAAAALCTGLVPLLSWLSARFQAPVVVASGFLLSAAAHAIEWATYSGGRPLAVIIYLHLGAFGAVLLSGFWSVIAERHDPMSARAAYGRIAGAGTAGGIAGSFAAERIAATLAPDAVLLLLASLHALSAIGVLALRRWPALLSEDQQDGSATGGVRATFQNPYVRTIAMFAILTAATASILDFLFKSNARAAFGTGPDLLRFFALFYGGVQVATFLAQSASEPIGRKFGAGGMMQVLPGGIGTASLVSLLFPGWGMLAVLRGFESVLRNSLYRGGYELLFVPMDARSRRRVKSFIDVLGDRIGEAAGSGLVQLVLVAGIAATRSVLLTAAVALAIAAVWLGRHFGALYLATVENQLLKHRDPPPVTAVSEAGWTRLPLIAAPVSPTIPPDPAAQSRPVGKPRVDPEAQLLDDLRSPDAARVKASLARRAALTRVHVAQIIDLLAWDQVMLDARAVLEELAPSHLGMLIDAMVNPATDFATRRRLPRILSSVPSRRTLDGLMNGLNDARFEVRYHCSRAFNRILAASPELSVDRAHMIAIVERELHVPPQLWRGYRLLDRPDMEEAPVSVPAHIGSMQVEYVFRLLATIVPREPLEAAVYGIHSLNAGVRGLAIEYLDQVLPPAVLERLHDMIAAIPSDADAPEQAVPRPPAR